jgi:hypothetical protein
LSNSLSLEQVSIVHSHELDLQKLMRQKGEKHRDNLKEKKKLECYIVNLFIVDKLTMTS